MELTAEQKYLKALAEWLDIENIPKNRIQEASREYLDQFRGVAEKVDQFTDSSKKVNEPNSLKEYIQPFKGVLDTPLIRSDIATEFHGCDCTMKVRFGSEPEPAWTPEELKLYLLRLANIVSNLENISDNAKTPEHKFLRVIA